MSVLKRTYEKIRIFVDEFANSTAGNVTPPPKMGNKNAWYAEWDDNYLGILIDNNFTKLLLKKISVLREIADSYYGQQIEEILNEATELTTESYPTLYQIYAYCCQKLGMYNRPQAFITGRLNGINALSLEVNSRQLILLSPRAAIGLTTNEQAFLLGHEIGHHQQGNLVCHTVNGFIENFNNTSEILAPLVCDTLEVPLKRWCRCSEFNADRAGYICCNDGEVIKNLFFKLGMKDVPSAYDDYKEVGASHPMLHTRWKVLREYIVRVQNDIQQ